ncbi:MAG: hypothetical protein U1F65_07105 [Verrucomicrobiota bacterium]
MKRILQTALVAGLALLAVPGARAWTYNDGDTLLIFRSSGFNDVEFNVGNISQFTNLANGVTITVPNWSRTLVTNTFGEDLSGVSVIVTATKSSFDPSPAAWLTSQNPAATVKDLTPSAWQSKLYSPINAIGTKPVLNLLPATLTNAYSIDPVSLTTRPSAYDYIVSGQNASLLPFFGGNVSFNVEGAVPSSFGFWQIAPSSLPVKPAAKYVGTFTITAGGLLTFTAGPLTTAAPPQIVGITRAGAVSTVTFTTTSGGNYSLVYSTAPAGSLATWSVVSGPVAGTGANVSLNHTTSGAAGFYGVVRTP